MFLTTQIFLACHENIKKETAEDRISVIADSLYKEVPYLPRLCDSLDVVSLKVNIGDCQLHVEIEGKGTPVVLINGGPGGTHHYFHPWFSRLSLSNKVIYYDQRGTGQSDFISGDGYTFEQAAADLEALRTSLGIDNWVVCGYSYGGGLAQYYTLKYPEYVNGLVLISTLPMLPHNEFDGDQDLYMSDEEKERKNEIIKAYLDGNLSMEAFLYNLSLNGDWKRQHYLKPTHNQIVRHALYEWVHDANFNSIMSESNSVYNFENVFDDCPIPTLVFEGDKDLTWGKSKASIIRRNHPRAEFHKVFSAGHPVFAEIPDYIFTVLSTFISSLEHIEDHRIKKWEEELKAFEIME